MSIPEKQTERRNRTVTLYMGNTQQEYEAWIASEGIEAVIERVEIADSLNWGCLANRHALDCSRQLQYTHHGSYERQLKYYDGSEQTINIYRVRCLECAECFTVQPSFVVRYKRQETDAIEKLMTLLFITEDSYRMAGVSQALGIDRQHTGSWAALEANQASAIHPRALWGLVQWFGQLSPAQLNLALGVEPPEYIIEDEKHVKEEGEKAYVPMIYAPKEALIWWIDYLHSASEVELRASFERFKALNERLSQITGATVDGWEAAQNALRASFSGITLAECHLHALLSLSKHLATYKRKHKAAGTPISEEQEALIRHAFIRVLSAPTSEAYQQALEALPEAFQDPSLVSRKQALIEKQPLFQAWIEDSRLAIVTTALDQCMKFLNRKFENMQTFRGPMSALATVNAWAITRNCWRFLKGAKRAGLSPLELAGADFIGIPWLQIVNLVLSAWPSLPMAASALLPST